MSRNVRRSTEINRHLLDEHDEHLNRDGRVPPMRGKRVSRPRWLSALDAVRADHCSGDDPMLRLRAGAVGADECSVAYRCSEHKKGADATP
jgi:hypothetical protein